MFCIFMHVTIMHILFFVFFSDVPGLDQYLPFPKRNIILSALISRPASYYTNMQQAPIITLELYLMIIKT